MFGASGIVVLILMFTNTALAPYTSNSWGRLRVIEMPGMNLDQCTERANLIAYSPQVKPPGADRVEWACAVVERPVK